MSSAKAVSFLQKKSWHTSTMQNMEKVWKAEERTKKEDKKMEELRQELAEEREMEDLRRAQETLTGVKKKDRVDFIYAEPLLNEPSADDYLLGQKYKESDDDNDVKTIRQKPGSLWLDQPSINSDSIQDKRTKIREDPLFTIRKEEQNKKTALKNNPIKMQQLREEILKQKLRAELKKEKKRKHKMDKSDKKSKRRKTENGVTAVGSSDRDISSPNRSNVTQDSSERRDISERTERSEQSERSERMDRGERMERSERTERAERSERMERMDRVDRVERTERVDRSDGRVDISTDRRDSGRNSRNGYDRDSRSVNNYYRSSDRHSSSGKKKGMSEDEKQRKLEEMRKDAKEMEKIRIENVTKYNLEDAAERAQSFNKDNKNDPKFISSIGQEVFSGGSTASVADRVKRNRNFIQKTNLDERGFLN